jgi:ssDNA-binding Zn-finger/Zn-ribbon topoisomerase 1
MSLEKIAKILLDEDYKTEFNMMFIPISCYDAELRGMVLRTNKQTKKEKFYMESAYFNCKHLETAEPNIIKAKVKLLNSLLDSIQFEEVVG